MLDSKKAHYLRKDPLSGAGIIWLFACGVVLLPAERLGELLGLAGTAAFLTGTIVIRAIAFCVLGGFAIRMRFSIFAWNGLKPALLCLPFLIAAINNAPWIALATGAARVSAQGGVVAAFLLECLAVAAFEELVFRGMILPLFAEKARNKRELFFALTASAAVFGLTHLVNLIGGANFGAVVMQVGYSFLIGAMCGLVLLLTRSLPLCILLHAVYNMGGLLIETVGEGSMWDTPTVILTAILAVAVVVYGAILFFKTPASRMFGIRGSVVAEESGQNTERADGLDRSAEATPGSAEATPGSADGDTKNAVGSGAEYSDVRNRDGENGK